MDNDILKYSGAQALNAIVADAGGELVGRTRLQKVAYLLSICGFEDVFDFEYRHYGPFSQKLATAISVAEHYDILTEEHKRTNGGNRYSVFKTDTDSSLEVNSVKHNLISLTSDANSIELELAATAAFLAHEGFADPWLETVNRKPEKASSMAGAKKLYAKLMELNSPMGIPAI